MFVESTLHKTIGDAEKRLTESISQWKSIFHWSPKKNLILLRRLEKNCGAIVRFGRKRQFG